MFKTNKTKNTNHKTWQNKKQKESTYAERLQHATGTETIQEVQQPFPLEIVHKGSHFGLMISCVKPPGPKHRQWTAEA